jgi:hypothetical protein
MVIDGHPSSPRVSLLKLPLQNFGHQIEELLACAAPNGQAGNEDFTDRGRIEVRRRNFSTPARLIATRKFCLVEFCPKGSPTRRSGSARGGRCHRAGSLVHRRVFQNGAREGLASLNYRLASGFSVYSPAFHDR